MTTPVQINCAQRAIIVPEQASACLITGTDKLENGYGNGDCLLLDLQNLFFAVSDSSDRWPTASRSFLERLTRNLSQAPAPPDTRDEWRTLVNAAYARQNYNHRATYTGVTIRHQEGRPTAIITHGGDSSILVLNIKTKKIKFQTDANMSFVGRAKGLSDVVRIPIENEDDRIIIASDGLSDIARLAGDSIEEMCLAASSRFPVNEVPQQIFKFFQRQQATMKHDDIAIIALNPLQLSVHQQTCLLMGGTTANEEKDYWANLRESNIADEWITPEDLDQPNPSAALAGIRNCR